MPSLRHDRFDIDGATRYDGLAGDPFEILMRAEGATPAQVLAATIASIDRARPSWHSEAACRGSDIDFTSNTAKDRAAAFSLCGACPVMAECRAWADEVDDRVAILGGEDWPARRARQALARRQTGEVAT